MATGIETRHARGCRTRSGGRCNCEPVYRAWVWSPADRKKIRKAFSSHAAAKAWRKDASDRVEKRTLRATPTVTLREAFHEWADLAESGAVLTRSRKPFKPSTVRSYRTSFARHVDEDLGGPRIGDVRRSHLMDLTERMTAAGHDPSTIANAILPIRVVYRRLVSRGEIAVNPTAGLELDRTRGRRERVADPSHVARLLAPLDTEAAAIYGLAAYGGLRRGEIGALRARNVADENGGRDRIDVIDSFDFTSAEFVGPKSAAGIRQVHVVRQLRQLLAAHLMATGRRGDDLLFPHPLHPTRPFDPKTLSKRVTRAWDEAEIPESDRLTLHRAASLLRVHARRGWLHARSDPRGARACRPLDEYAVRPPALRARRGRDRAARGVSRGRLDPLLESEGQLATGLFVAACEALPVAVPSLTIRRRPRAEGRVAR